MYKKLSIIAIAGALSFAGSAAHAVQATVPFTSVVTATCILTVGTPGVMTSNALFNGLSSTNAGGVAGTVSALATGAAFKVSAIAPTTFTVAPSGGGDNVTFSAAYRATGATSAGSTPGNTETTLNSGLTNVSVDLSAAKSAGNYTAGAYAAEVIVRCE